MVKLATGFGLELHDGVVTPIAEEGTSLPTEVRKTFSTAVYDQQSIEIKLYQGDGDTVADNELLGQVEFVDLPPEAVKAGTIEVTFSIAGTGDVSLSAEARIPGERRKLFGIPIPGTRADTFEPVGMEGHDDLSTVAVQ